MPEDASPAKSPVDHTHPKGQHQLDGREDQHELGGARRTHPQTRAQGAHTRRCRKGCVRERSVGLAGVRSPEKRDDPQRPASGASLVKRIPGFCSVKSLVDSVKPIE